MCGINGIVMKVEKSKEALTSSLLKMNDRIIHRGPDQDGVFIDQDNEHTIGMAMRRLSIIDLSTGSQPIFSSDRTKVLVFNGEIYNYLQLRVELLEDGVHFQTESDTEVILKLYEKHGTLAFSMLDGMFAFSLYDKELGKVYIARDFFGEKPLYYYHQRRTIYMGV